MLKFYKKSDTTYAVDDDGKTIALVEVEGNTIKYVTYESKETDVKYGDFTLRSIAFVLRNKYPEVKCDFTDIRLKAIGFKESKGKMSASSLKINFDTCHCNNEENEDEN